MKIKLKKFTEFSKSILPNEAKYLASIHKFTDSEKIRIMEQLVSNALSQDQFSKFDTAFDKRKYTYIKTWIEKKLAAIDVDKTIDWLIVLKKKILTDAITASEEKQFLQHLSNYKEVDYNFQNLYELVKEYRSYLLIRMRYKDHHIVANFLQQFKSHYAKTRKIQEQLYTAITEITNQYTLNNNETKYWEKWLLKVFKTQEIDGRNRYQAFVLLAFMYTNYNENKKLKLLFDKIDIFFSQGQMYSRRLLSNYYAGRVLLHSKQNELAKAEYYGFLSIRQNNDDTLMYVNNFAAILLRNNKPKQALSLLETYKEHYTTTHNYHQKIGYTSYQIRALTELQQEELAEFRAKTFLKHYKAEVLKHRWHHFFTSYIGTLISQEKYMEILRLSNKFHLREKEKERRKKNSYVPNISWSISLSKYMEGKISANRLSDEIKEPLQGITPTENQKQLILQVMKKLSKNLPEAFVQLKSYL